MLIESYKSICQTGVSLILALAATTVWAGNIVMSVEEPSASSVYTGVANVRGWAVSSAGIDFVELYVDGELKTELPLGGRRSDVGNEYPNYPDSNNSGFSAAYNYSNLDVGSHTFRIRAVDNDGTSSENSVAFNVVRFDNTYISDPTTISLNGATGSFGDRTITFTNMTADGKQYNIQLKWRTEIQGFAITQITPVGHSSGDRYYVDAVRISNDCNVSSLPEMASNLRHNLELEQNGNELVGNIDKLTETVNQSASTAGEVNTAREFWLQSERVSVDVSGSCRVAIHDFHYGNLSNGSVTVNVNYEYSGNCGAMFSCGANYTGTITQVNTAAANYVPAASDHMQTMLQIAP